MFIYIIGNNILRIIRSFTNWTFWISNGSQSGDGTTSKVFPITLVVSKMALDGSEK